MRTSGVGPEADSEVQDLDVGFRCIPVYRG